MREFIQKAKRYFIVSPYTSSEINDFANQGNLPEEFSIKRRRVRGFILIMIIIGFIFYLIFS
jgi:hypothetical protein